MPVLPETPGDELGPEDEENDNPQEENGCEPEKMLNVFKSAHGSNPGGVPCMQDSLGPECVVPVNTASMGRDSVIFVTSRRDVRPSSARQGR